MRTLAFMVMALLLSGPAFAKFDYSKCLKQSLDRANVADILRAAGAKFSAEDLVKLNEDPAIRQGADLQRALLPHIAGIPQDFSPASATKTKDSKGVEHEKLSIDLTNFHPLDWQDPTKKEKIIRGQCSQMFGQFTDMCVRSFYAKENYIDGFLGKHKNKIQQMSDEMIRNPKVDLKTLTAGYDFTYESGKDPTLAGHVYLGLEETENLMRSGVIVMAKDSSGKSVGPALRVGKPGGGGAELYLIPNQGTRENPKFINPYFFVFGEVPASEWNQHFRVGNLTPS